MTTAQLLNQYFDKKIDAIQAIRTLSGMFDPSKAIGILTIICQITRIEQGDLDEETFRSLYKLEREDESKSTATETTPKPID